LSLIIGYYVEKNSAFFVCSGEAEHRLVEVFGKARIGMLMSLLGSLKFCVIEHQPA
jgi:hypothetical protein